jgi:hypothetical protein
MTAPATGATVAGQTTVAANASDPVAVAGVQFLLDGSPLGAEVTSAPYALVWNNATVSDGSHTLAARARDSAGLSTVSSAISVTVQNSSNLAVVGQWSSVYSLPAVAPGTPPKEQGALLSGRFERYRLGLRQEFVQQHTYLGKSLLLRVYAVGRWTSDGGGRLRELQPNRPGERRNIRPGCGDVDRCAEHAVQALVSNCNHAVRWNEFWSRLDGRPPRIPTPVFRRYTIPRQMDGRHLRTRTTHLRPIHSSICFRTAESSISATRMCWI